MLTSPRTTESPRFPTIAHGLAEAGAARPDGTITIVDRHGQIDRRTFRQTWERTCKIAAGFRARDIGNGDRVLFTLGTSHEFVCAFAAAAMVGAVPVPIAPPRATREDSSDRAEFFSRIAERLAVRAALFPADDHRAQRPPPFGQLAHILDVSMLQGSGSDDHITNHTLAYIQPTSGTTGTRRGVELTHRAVTRATASTSRAIEATSADVVVSWLPLHNVLGLVGMLTSAYLNHHDTVLIAPERFATHPQVWLQMISASRGTVTAAPSHAFHFCVRRAPDSALSGVDLSSLRTAIVGGDHVRKVHLRAFEKRFERYGFRSEAFTPVFGLSESTLCVTLSKNELVFDDVDRDALAERNEIIQRSTTDPLPTRMAVASVGRPVAGTDVMIVDRGGVEVSDTTVGEIAVRTDMLMNRYFDAPHRRSATSKTRVVGEWLMTGDRGYIREGNLYVIGREVDLFVTRDGTTIYPEDIEHVVEGIDGIRTGCTVAFPDEFRNLVVAIEAQPGADIQKLRDRIATQLSNAFGIVADSVVVLSPRSVPRSPDGKVRRHLVQTFHAQGLLDRNAREADFDGARRILRRSRHELQKWLTKKLKR